MNIAAELEKHAQEELSHALIISKQIDYLGGMPAIHPKAVRTSENAKEMLGFDLENETETIRNYRERVRQCDALGEFAMAEHIREILMQEQEHQIDLATALGIEVPNPGRIPDPRIFVRSSLVPPVLSPQEAISPPAPGIKWPPLPPPKSRFVRFVLTVLPDRNLSLPMDRVGRSDSARDLASTRKFGRSYRNRRIAAASRISPTVTTVCAGLMNAVTVRVRISMNV